MKEIGSRLKELRDSVHLSQAKMAAMMETNQTNIARIETGQIAPQLNTLLWYAEYFDVSLDYIFGRTNNPKGKLYKNKPKIPVNSDEMKQFIEMCFDPKSPMSNRLKQALLDVMRDE